MLLMLPMMLMMLLMLLMLMLVMLVRLLNEAFEQSPIRLVCSVVLRFSSSAFSLA